MKILKLLKLIIILFTTVITFSTKSLAEINVAFTIDNNYPVYTLLVINSILLNNKSNSDYNFWIVENNLTPGNKNMMKKYVEKRKQKINFINISMDKVDKGEHLFKNTIFAQHVSRIGNARVLLPEILPKSIDKVLYLDSDILVLSDLKELYDTDIRYYAAAMARNNSDVIDKVPEDKPSYFNSGVILINTNYWRRINATQKMIKYLQCHNLQLPDQDTINKVLYGRIKKLNQKWNNQTNNLKCPLTTTKNGGILHYIGGMKPWDVRANKSDEVKIYYKYWNKSGLSRYKYRRYIKFIRLYYQTCLYSLDGVYEKYSQLFANMKENTYNN